MKVLSLDQEFIRTAFIWRGVRAVEGARLESVCTPLAYRGFDKTRSEERTNVRGVEFWTPSVAMAPCRVRNEAKQMTNLSLSMRGMRTFFYLERCPSGRRSTPGKCVYATSVPRVRIPLSPPLT